MLHAVLLRPTTIDRKAPPRQPAPTAVSSYLSRERERETRSRSASENEGFTSIALALIHSDVHGGGGKEDGSCHCQNQRHSGVPRFVVVGTTTVPNSTISRGVGNKIYSQNVLDDDERKAPTPLSFFETSTRTVLSYDKNISCSAGNIPSAGCGCCDCRVALFYRLY